MSEQNDLRSRILSADDITSEMVEVPQWGVTVEVRSMDARSRILMTQDVSGDDGVSMERLYPDMVIQTAHDPATGERIFSADDRDALLAKSSAALDILATAAMRVSGMTPTSVDESGKDSSSTGTDDSLSS